MSLNQTQGFATPFAGPPLKQRKMIFQDHDMGTFVGNPSDKQYAQMAASGQLNSSNLKNLKNLSSKKTPRSNNKVKKYKSPNIALVDTQHKIKHSDQVYPHQNQTLDPFGINYNDALKRDTFDYKDGQDDFDFTSKQ